MLILLISHSTFCTGFFAGGGGGGEGGEGGGDMCAVTELFS